MCIYDQVQGFEAYISWELAQWSGFFIGKWIAEQCSRMGNNDAPWVTAHAKWMHKWCWEDTTIQQWSRKSVKTDGTYYRDLEDRKYDDDSDHNSPEAFVINLPQLGIINHKKNTFLGLGTIQVDCNKYVSIQRNAAKVKGSERLLPKPVVIKVKIDGHPARALVDSRSLGDFISSTLVDQLKLKRNILDKAIGLQLAIQGSWSKINAEVSALLEYQNIKGQRQFDIRDTMDVSATGMHWVEPCKDSHRK